MNIVTVFIRDRADFDSIVERQAFVSADTAMYRLAALARSWADGRCLKLKETEQATYDKYGYVLTYFSDEDDDGAVNFPTYKLTVV